MADVHIRDLDTLYRRQFGVGVRHLFGEHTRLYMWQNRSSGFIWFDPPVSGDEGFYNALQQKAWYYADHKREFEVAAPFIRPDDRVLEVGSGKGNFGKYLNSPYYVGLDFSEKARELAAANGVVVRTETLEEHVSRYPEQYDVVCAFQVLEHVPDVKAFLKDMMRGLRSGGRLLFSVPSQDSYIARAHNQVLNLPPHHISRYTEAFIRRIPDYFDLELLHLERDPLQPVHYTDYLTQLWLEAFRSRLRRPYRLLCTSMGDRFLHLVAYALARVMAPGLSKYNVPHGHTITAVFHQKSQ
jgi:2-polyprenyl-3-methyl-5-hydroxy-6-metoxy-1,4-benzoquinol methylase